jgi:hypothetical protein
MPEKLSQREQHRNYKRQWRAKHKELGLCHHCTAPALPQRTRCAYHTYLDNQRYRLRYHSDETYRHRQIAKAHNRSDRWLREGKCVKCGTPLIEGEGKVCVNCCLMAQYANTGRVLP